MARINGTPTAVATAIRLSGRNRIGSADYDTSRALFPQDRWGKATATSGAEVRKSFGGRCAETRAFTTWPGRCLVAASVRRGIVGALAALAVGGCGLVLDVGHDEPAAAAGDGGPSADAAGSDSGDSDAGGSDASPGADAGGDACVPEAETCNGLDDNCDGVIDEGCCARYVLAGAGGTGLSPGDPMSSIQSAVDSMVARGETGDVCVAATTTGTGCAPTTYIEAVTMAEGVSVLGGYRSGTVVWDRTDAACETIIDAATNVGVLFGEGVTQATRLDGFTVLGRSGVTSSAAITVQAGATISNNRVRGGSTESAAFGIQLEACDVEPVRIVDNHEIVGAREGYADGTAISSSDCVVAIRRNAHIGGRGGGHGDAWGILCQGGSNCTVAGNGSIVGIAATATGGWGRGVTIHDAATGEVVRNASVAGCAGSAGYCIGILVSDAAGTPLVDRNVVVPSDGSSWNSGILVRRSDATVSNNLVVVDDGNGIELALNRPAASTTEATVHSNTVVAPPTTGSSRTVRLLLADYEGLEIRPPNGIFRNNIAACLGTGTNRNGFTELGNSGKPRIFENNDIWGCGTIYALSTGTLLAAVADIDALPGANGNMSVDPSFVSPPSDYHLSGTSLLIDAGTSSGTVPPADYDGEARPRGSAPDVGFDEAR